MAALLVKLAADDGGVTTRKEVLKIAGQLINLATTLVAYETERHRARRATAENRRR